MSTQLKKWSSLILFALAANDAVASLPVVGSDRQAVQVSVSAAEANRIAVEGRRIVHAVPAQPGVIDYKKDQTQGALYFTMTGKQASIGTVTLFVTDDRETTYQLVLVPRPIGGESILIKPPAETPPPTAAASRLPTYQRRLKEMVLAMSQDGQAGARLERITVEREVRLWQEGRLILAAQFPDRELMGEKYVLTNVSRAEMVLAEQELFRPGVLGIAIANHTLAPGQSTDIFVVRERRSHE